MAALAISFDDPRWDTAPPHVVILTDGRGMARDRVVEWVMANGDGFFSWRWQASNPGVNDELGYRIEIHIQFTCLTSAMAFKMMFA